MSEHSITGFFIFHHVIGDAWRRKEIKWLRAHRFLLGLLVGLLIWIAGWIAY